jgi:hypothetical protein
MDATLRGQAEDVGERLDDCLRIDGRGRRSLGAGLEFVERGTRAFKGISGEREIFEARASKRS